MANKFGLPGDTQVFTTKYVLLAKTKITYIEQDPEGDWYFFGSEPIKDRSDYRPTTLTEILQIDRKVEAFADLKKGEYAFWDRESEAWKRAKTQLGGDGAFVTEKVLSEGLPVLFIYREDPDNDQDSGWRAFSGAEDQEYINNPDNWKLVSLDVLTDRDPSVSEVLEYPVGSAFERNQENEDWIHVK